MSGLSEKVSSRAQFGTMIRRPRGLLTKEERSVIALKKAAEQARLQLKNALRVSVAIQAQITELTIRATAAEDEYQKSKAALEAK